MNGVTTAEPLISQSSQTAREETFVRFTRLAAFIAQTDIATVSLIEGDKLYFKAQVGFDLEEINAADSFTIHTVQQLQPLIVNDLSKDARFADNPIVQADPFIRFYAGFPISVNGEQNIGALCVMHGKPRHLTQEQINALSELSRLLELQINHADLALTDDMTGLLNRRGFYAKTESFIERCIENQESYVLIYFDIDGFKTINDQFGHSQGDLALRLFATALRHSVRGGDLIARLGGDEFCVLMTLNGLQREVDIPARLEQELTHLAQNEPFTIHFSSGTIIRTPDVEQAPIDSLLNRADQAMYQEKHRKKLECKGK